MSKDKMKSLKKKHIILVGSMLLLGLNSAALADPVVLISGGTSGIGYELVRQYLKKGYKVALFGGTDRKVEALKAEFQSSDRVFVAKVQAEDPIQLRTFVDNAEAKLGKISVLINNAAITGPLLPVNEVSAEEMQRTLSINLLSPIMLTSIVVQKMKADGTRGVILNVTSGTAKGVQGAALYSASKGGLNSFTAASAKDYAHLGIKVFAFNPGHVDTPMQENVRNGNPEKFPAAQVFAKLKAEGKLVNPEDSATQIIHVIEHTSEYEPGSVIEYNSVASKLKETSQIAPKHCDTAGPLPESGKHLVQDFSPKAPEASE